jgi:hypothetical protein
MRTHHQRVLREPDRVLEVDINAQCARRERALATTLAALPARCLIHVNGRSRLMPINAARRAPR